MDSLFDSYFSSGHYCGFRWLMPDAYPGKWCVSSKWGRENFAAVVDDFGDLVRVPK